MEKYGLQLRIPPVQQRKPESKYIGRLLEKSKEREKCLEEVRLHRIRQENEAMLWARLTGLRLEMDQTEALHLVESPDALEVLAAAQASGPEQLGSLSLNG